MLMVTGMSLLPRRAEARALICAPDNRGCFWTRLSCSQVEIPKTWNCTNKLVVNNKKDHVLRENNGRVAVVINGGKSYVLSEALERQIVTGKVTGTSLASLVLKDSGPAAEETMQLLSKELSLPVVKETAVKAKVR